MNTADQASNPLADILTFWAIAEASIMIVSGLCIILTLILTWRVVVHTKRTARGVAELVRIEHSRIEAARRAHAARVTA